MEPPVVSLDIIICTLSSQPHSKGEGGTDTTAAPPGAQGALGWFLGEFSEFYVYLNDSYLGDKI